MKAQLCRVQKANRNLKWKGNQEKSYRKCAPSVGTHKDSGRDAAAQEQYSATSHQKSKNVVTPNGRSIPFRGIHADVKLKIIIPKPDYDMEWHMCSPESEEQNVDALWSIPMGRADEGVTAASGEILSDTLFEDEDHSIVVSLAVKSNMHPESLEIIFSSYTARTYSEDTATTSCSLESEADRPLASLTLDNEPNNIDQGKNCCWTSMQYSQEVNADLCGKNSDTEDWDWACP